jgi:hypothetical protein
VCSSICAPDAGSGHNHCQECSLCCQLLGVVGIAKPPGTMCWFCKPGHGGCTKYKQSDFPDECANYACLWLQTRQQGHTPLSMELRPDRSKVVIDFRKRERAYNVRCDPAYPDAWRQANVQRVLAALAEAGSMIYLIKPSGEERPLKLVNDRNA